MSENVNIHPNVARVTAAAAAAGLTIETRKFPEGTKTALDAANAIGVTLGQIVKSLIFAVDGEVVLALVSGSNQLDEKKLALALPTAFYGQQPQLERPMVLLIACILAYLH